jgi:hypothetical protein
MLSVMSAISNPVQEVLDLFATDLTNMRFGDVDAQSLSNAAAAVQSAADEVASVEAQLADARGRLHENQDALLQRVQRALAYARVYAEADGALSARLEAITLPRPTRRVRPDASAISVEPQIERRPRGRPRKTPVAVPVLEDIASTAE